MHFDRLHGRSNRFFKSSCYAYEIEKRSQAFRLNHYYFGFRKLCCFLEALTVKLPFVHLSFEFGSYKNNLHFFYFNSRFKIVRMSCDYCLVPFGEKGGSRIISGNFCEKIGQSLRFKLQLDKIDSLS